ncbi:MULTISPECIES: hypothetical protein [Niastella]|uniref:DUF4595 domain-containing protein n=1 Tax=Niastella soli TaxID=2821487 RepID=A0ABS3Z3P9_9BACT|nr:hypothetical protein [Niastella soli]MBO9204658.1 hypothetical protein [Niastella soli]
MTKRVSPLLLFSLISLLGACDKDDKIDEPEIVIPQFHIKSITWNYGLTGNFVYNADSSLKQIDYTYQNVGGFTGFGWSGNLHTELYDDRSLYKNVFEYDTDGYPVKMKNVTKADPTDTQYQLEFLYNAGKLQAMKYAVFNEDGTTELRSSSTYHYNAGGDLEKVVTQFGKNLITHTIDAYSAPVSFLPAHYLDPTLLENYTIYNMAVLQQLQQLHKLPAKVTRVVKTGSNPEYIDKIEDQVFTVNNYRIDKVSTTISYPQMPNNTSHFDAVYSYY